MTPLDRLLESYRAAAISERDKGTAFEKLVAAWLVADPVQSKRFAQLDALPNLHTIDTGQCFPFWLYEEDEGSEADLLGERIPG
ncbi:MAG: hypothetical protein OXC10_00080 [Rhodospirillaceae bacterium]|nr:hypothetical protein [Rhodospirillaceae bacterium]